MRIDNDTSRYSITSMLVGVVSLFIWLIPVISIFTSLFTMYVGFRGVDSERHYFSKAGILMGGISFVLTMLRSGLVNGVV